MSSTTTRTDTKHGRYYTHPTTEEQLISVTTILDATDAKRYLIDWSAQLAAESAVDNHRLIAAMLRNDRRDDAVAFLADQARQSRELKANTGTYAHDVVEALILWAASPEGTGRDIALPTLPEHLAGALYDDQPLEEVVDWMLDGFTNFVAAFQPIFHASEMTVFNRVLGVAGTLDMIIELPGMTLRPDGRLGPGNGVSLCVDTKTGRDPGATVQEQLAAYRRMREALMPHGEIEPMPATTAGAVLHLRPEYGGGYRLTPISAADDAKAWNRFRRAVELHTGRKETKRKPGKVAYPLRPDGTMPSPRLQDLDGEGYGRALSPLMNSGLNDLDDVAAFTRGDLLQVKGIGAKTVDTVRRMLADYGLHFADESLKTGKAA